MQYDLPQGYLSASSLTTLLTCPRMFEFKYIDRIPTPPTGAMITGTALHRTFQNYYQTAMESAQRYTSLQAKDLAVAMLEDTITTEECYLSSEERTFAISIVQDLSMTYVEHVAKGIMPLAVEEEHVWTARCGVPLLAYIDLRHQLPDGSQGIADYKITGKRWTLDKVMNSLQFSLYDMMTGIRDLTVHNLVKASVSKRISAQKQIAGVTDITPSIRILHHCFDGSSNDHLESIIETSARLITSGIFTPCALDAWNCSPDFCGYWSLCRGKGQSKVIDMAA